MSSLSINQNALTSPLLRLPLEIRNNIWSEVLGNRLIHVRYLYDDELSFETNEELHSAMTWSRQLHKTCGSAWRHVVCERDCPEAQEDRRFTSDGETFLLESHHACESDLGYDTYEPEQFHGVWGYFHHEMMRLSVLRSCRQIYVEANNILWTSNTFSFADSVTFRRFMMTRNIHQKRLIESLRLQMEWVDKQWNKSLNMALVRSLSGLRRLRLNIEHKLLFGSYESEKSLNLPYPTLHFDGLKKLSTLLLTEVEIVVETPVIGSEDHLWTKEDRQDFAEGLRTILLNPKGAQTYAEDELKWKEKRRREKEDAAKIKALIYKPRVQAEPESMANPPPNEERDGQNVVHAA